MEKGKFKTRELVQETLKNMGCQPEINDADQIVFQYQGTRFFIDADNNIPFIQIFETWWASIGLTNPDAELLKVAINEANANSFPTVLYSEDKEHNLLGVHCRLRTVFTADLPNLEDLMKALLNSFFQTNQVVNATMTRLTGKEPEMPEGVKPVAPQNSNGELLN